MVLCAEEFGAGQGGAGEGVGKGFGGMFGAFYEGCLGFCGRGGGGEVGYFFRDGFAQVDEGFFLARVRIGDFWVGVRGLGSRKIHLRRFHWRLVEFGGDGGGCGEVRYVQEFQVGCFQLIDAFLQFEIFLRQFRLQNRQYSPTR